MAKFQIGDEIDQALVKVIVHEYSRCKLAFGLFVTTFPKKIEEFGKQKIEVNLFRYNAYALFVQHLYEFIVACVKRDRRSTEEITADVMDQMITREIERILEQKRHAIDNGYASAWENARSAYEVSCPETFAKDFRRVRNSVSHADYRRIIEKGRITLSDFYRQYHSFAILLYNDAEDWWSIDSMKDLDLGDVTDFNKLIFEKES